MVTALTFFIILVILVVVHEFGHFFAAKKCGVFVEEFGFGFPPKLLGKKLGETLYTLNLIPLGGFVRLFGEEYHEELKIKDMKIPAKRAFVSKPSWQKAIIIAGGVIMNFLLGWVILSYLFTNGFPVPSGVTVEKVQPNSPAARVGVKAHDELVSIDRGTAHIPLNTTQDLISSAATYGDQEIVLKVKRGGTTLMLPLTPRRNPPLGQGALGVVIAQKVTIQKYPWYSAPFYALGHAATLTSRIATELLKVPVQFITHQKSSVEFSGPIGIAKVVGEARRYGADALLEIIALLSLNLAVINILPFPALDGGRMMFVAYEWITGRQPNRMFEKYLNMSGIVILLALSVVVTYHDIVKFWP